jgi:hypothetical protein
MPEAIVPAIEPDDCYPERRPPKGHDARHRDVAEAVAAVSGPEKLVTRWASPSHEYSQAGCRERAAGLRVKESRHLVVRAAAA